MNFNIQNAKIEVPKIPKAMIYQSKMSYQCLAQNFNFATKSVFGIMSKKI